MRKSESHAMPGHEIIFLEQLLTSEIYPGQPKVSKLVRIYESGQLQSVTIGKLYGHTTLKLIPSQGALPTTEDPDFDPALSYAVTHGGAVSYPDGHPSDDIAFPQISQSSFSSTSQPTRRHFVKDDDDDILRRFVSLGFVVQESEHHKGTWEKTGHVLVMDMGDKRARHRHPWMILASKWPTDGEETAEGEDYYRAEEHVLRDASDERGIFPGDHTRTPICRIEPLAGDQRPVVLQLGPEFLFNPVRYGNKYHTHSRTRFGPSLVHVMDWYWDPPAKQHVCYTKDGLEYMRYDPQTMEYTYPDLNRMSFIGEHGMFGTVTGRVTGFVPLAQRTDPAQGMANLSLGGGFQATHQRLISASSGF